MRRITIIERTGSEEWFLMGVREAICSRTIVYSATRQFDEMILKGRFTNARRAHEPDPFYPALPDAEDLDWQNIRNIMGIKDEIIRAEDTPSKGVVHEYDHGDPGLVLIHNLRDVVEMIMVDGKADTECFKWCTRVMRDNEFALKKIMGGEE
jgi:hypothetical protein